MPDNTNNNDTPSQISERIVDGLTVAGGTLVALGIARGAEYLASSLSSDGAKSVVRSGLKARGRFRF